MSLQMNKRQTKILNELVKSDGYLTSNYLGKVLGVSSRTIRNDLKELDNLFLKRGMAIESVVSKGYRISKNHISKISKLVDLETSYITPYTSAQRIDFIIKKLLLNPKGLYLWKLRNDLFVSDSTINRDLIDVRCFFKLKGVSLTKNHEGKHYISGNEELIRDLYYHFFCSIDVINLTKSSDNLDLFKRKLKNISRIFRKEVFIKDRLISGYLFNELSLKTAISLFRFENGFTLNKKLNERVKKTYLSTSVIEILTSIVSLSNPEENYLIRMINNTLSQPIIIDISEFDEVILETATTFGYPVNQELRDKLLNAFQEKSFIENSYLEEAKIEYPLASEIALHIFDSVTKTKNDRFSESTLIKLIYIIANEMELKMLKRESETQRVVLISDLGKDNFELIRSKLSRYLPRLNIVGSYPKYLVKEAIALQPDLIITTKPLEQLNIPVIVINALLKDYDILNIKTLINQLDDPNKKVYSFLNLFRENLFVKDSEVETEYEAIEELYLMMKQANLADEEYFREVLHRESISSTYIDNMTAIPHAIGTSNDENVVGVLITKKPFNWNNNPVQVVFLLNIPNVSESFIKQIFKSFYDLISSSSAMNRVIKSKNYYEFIKNINQ